MADQGLHARPHVLVPQTYTYCLGPLIFTHCLVYSQESKERQALWVIPQSMADVEDEVVRTVQSSVMTDRGVDVKRDLQVLSLRDPLPSETRSVVRPWL